MFSGFSRQCNKMVEQAKIPIAEDTLEGLSILCECNKRRIIFLQADVCHSLHCASRSIPFSLVCTFPILLRKHQPNAPIFQCESLEYYRSSFYHNYLLGAIILLPPMSSDPAARSRIIPSTAYGTLNTSKQ